MERRASLFLRGQRAFIHPLARTEAGFYIERPPIVEEQATDYRRMAERLLEALALYPDDIPTPPRGQLRSTLPALAGARSYAAFMDGTLHLTVTQHSEGLTLAVSRNAGPRDGFVPLPGSDGEIGCERDLAGLAFALPKAIRLATDGELPHERG